MKGPPPKGAKLKLLEKNPGKRKIPNNPKVRPLIDIKPAKWLSKVAKEYFKRIKTRLLRAKIVTELDEESIFILCQSYADFQKYTKVLEDEGATVSDGRGGVKKHPATTLQKESFNRFQTLADRFGLNPTSRNRLDVTPETPDEDREFEALLD